MMRRFCRYIEKVFDARDWLRGLADARPQPQIPSSAVFASVLMMFTTRCRSLNALEATMCTDHHWKRVVGRRLPSADTVSRVMAGIDPDHVRGILSSINQRLKRNKVLARHQGPLFVALDGHEFFRWPAPSLPSMQPAPRCRGPGQGR